MSRDETSVEEREKMAADVLGKLFQKPDTTLDRAVETLEAEALEIIVHKRTPGSGHLTATMSLDGAVEFADQELALGRAVILEIGTESVIIRKGKEIVDFVKRVLGVKTEPRPQLTTLSPMAGGAEVGAPQPDGQVITDVTPLEIPMPPLPERRYDGAVTSEPPSPYNPGRQPGRAYASPEAEMRAWRALVERIGERWARAMLAGGGYSVRSKIWPHVIYVVTPEIIKVVNQGIQVGRVCIVTVDGGSVWDAVLNRIQLLEAGVEGEVQVFATGQLVQG